MNKTIVYNYVYEHRQECLCYYKSILIFVIMAFLCTSNLFSQPTDNKPEEKKETLNEKWDKMGSKTGINVIGEKDNSLKNIPGSATVVGKKYLEQTQPVDAMEVLRRVPGASLRSMDSAGLTPNIAFRGVSNEESRKTLILEDGVLTSLSPYGQPESYYVPQIDRMERVEIVKGSGSILFGPSTIGGIVNFVTRKPPMTPTFSTKTVGGENGFFSNHTQYGGTFDKTGVDISYLHKHGDGFRDYNFFNVNEVNGKVIHEINENHSVSIKFGYHKQDARASYLGLTQGLFWKDPKINPAEFDKKELERNSTVIGHEYTHSENFKIITKAYATHATRNWQRQDFAYNSLNSYGVPAQPPADIYAIYSPGVIGVRPGDVLYMKNNSPKRDQTFNTLGIESRAEISFDLLSMKHSLDVGVRAHGEMNKNSTKNAPYPFIRDWYPYSQQDRQARAYSVYFQDRIQLTENLKIMPGARYETISQGVYNKRRLSTAKDVQEFRASKEGDIIFVDQGGETHTKVLLGGFGITYDITPDFNWLAGVHQGFSPPTYGTAISPTGMDYRLKAERSVNYETGFRGKLTKYLFTEVVGYVIYFRDQIINTNEVGGEQGTRPVNSGKTIHKGSENTITFDFGKFFNLYGWSIPLDLIYSYILAKSNNYERFPYVTNADGTIRLVDRAPFVKDEKGYYLKTNTNGNYLPYVPMHTATVALGVSHSDGYYIRGEYQYVDKQYSDLLNTRNETVDGSKGVIPKYDLINASLGYKDPIKKWSVFVTGKNLQNRQYVSGRLPIGIHPGAFRQINFGISIEF